MVCGKYLLAQIYLITFANGLPPAIRRDDYDDLVNEYLKKSHLESKCEAEGYQCVPYYQCRSNNSVNDIIDIRYGGKNHSGHCDHYLQKCCLLSDRIEKPKNTNILSDYPIPDEGCGFRRSKGLSFTITGGRDNETEYGEFPWMIAVVKDVVQKGDPTLEYLCGGSLIHPSVVLTASHYVSEEATHTLKVIAGEWDSQTDIELYPTQTRDAAEVLLHPNYDKTNLHNDVALILVRRPFELVKNVRTICLPPPNLSFDRSRCIATGWGKDIFGDKGQYQTIMKKIEMPIVSHDTCQANLRTTRLGPHFVLHDSFICAGGEGKDTCKGDGGGPLICPIAGQNNRYYQAGIVAWGIGCGLQNIPGTYASVSKFRLWIDEQFKYKNLDKSSYKL